MKKIVCYLKKYKKESVLGPLFKMLEASFELCIPLVMADMIDIGIAGRNLSYIGKMGLIMVALGLTGLVCSITAQFFAARAAVGCAKELRKDLFSHIQTLSYTELDTIGTSTLITRMTSDVNQVQNGVNLVLRLFLRSPFIVFGAMIMAFTIDVKAALVFTVTIPLLSIVVFGIMLLTIPLFKKVQERLDRVLQITRENLTGVRVIRAFHREKKEQGIFADANEELVKEQILTGRISGLMNPLTYVIINFSILVLIWTGAWQVEGGLITQGAVVALVNYMSQILVELVKLANLIITVTKAAACGNRIEAVLSLTSSLEEPKEEKEKEKRGKRTDESKEKRTDGQTDEREGTAGDMVPAVEFKQVSFTYKHASEPSLTELSFRAEQGDTIGIIGGTGSGKSTLIQLIPRFYDVTKGTIRVFGRKTEQYELSSLREKIGIVPQKSVLFKGTIRENLRWGKKDATDEEMWDALRASQAEEFVKEKDGGLDFQIRQDGRNLSGGQKQRLTIARALVKKPEILILDDSASALDYATDAKLRESIRNLDPQMTVFIVSQRTASVWNTDRILVLEDGEVVGMGTHEELLKDCEVYKEIYYSQFPEGGKTDEN